MKQTLSILLGFLPWIAFAAVAWLSIFMGKPFVLQFARETVPPERQTSLLPKPLISRWRQYSA